MTISDGRWQMPAGCDKSNYVAFANGWTDLALAVKGNKNTFLFL